MHDPPVDAARAEAVVQAVHAELPGLEAAIRPLVHAILAFAAEAEAAADAADEGGDGGMGRQPMRGLVIEGPSGVGKTSLAQAVARHLGLPHRYVAGSAVFGPNRGDAERAVERAFRGPPTPSPGRASPPILLFILDELEAVGKARAEARHVADLGALAALLEALDDPEQRRRVFVLGVAADAGRLDPALRQPGRLEGLVRLGTPAAAQRRVMLQGLLGRLPLVGGQQEHAALLDDLTRRTRGYTGADLARLCSEALAAAAAAASSAPGAGVPQPPLAVAPAHWEAALESARPAGIPWATPVEAALSDLAGVAEAVRVVTQAVLLPLSRPQALKAMGIPHASTGVLLHGPPGTGKSLLGRALAAAARPYASFLSVECPELVNKVVGESERAVAGLFQTARQAAPCILFLDHVEAIAGRRGFDTSSEQTMDRLLSTLLVEMDGVASSSSSSSSSTTSTTEAPVIVIAATNHRGLLDEAILRPGRLDLHVELPLPDEGARVAIFAHHLRLLPLAFDDGEGDVDGLAAALAARAAGLSGADIQGVCQEAALLSLRESLESTAVRPRHLRAALEGAVVAAAATETGRD